MICIFSNSNDYSTTEVIRWIEHLSSCDVLRINYNEYDSSSQTSLKIKNDSLSFEINDKQIALSEISVVWYRKGKNWLADEFYEVSIKEHERLTYYLNKSLKTEEIVLSEYIHYIIETSIPTLGSSSRCTLNKLITLHKAKQCGFSVPDFYISNNKSIIRNFFESENQLITKPMSEVLYFFDNRLNNLGYFSYTEMIEEESIGVMRENISPSFLQKAILKKYELRVFYLQKAFYSMAIFSQNDEKTKIDFRKYNEDKPNRAVPFCLPNEVKLKTQKLFNEIGLNTGSVDLIVDQDDNYFFLEINPVGQFGMVSEPCNYYLEKEIAINLLSYEQRN